MSEENDNKIPKCLIGYVTVSYMQQAIKSSIFKKLRDGNGNKCVPVFSFHRALGNKEENVTIDSLGCCFKWPRSDARKVQALFSKSAKVRVWKVKYNLKTSKVVQWIKKNP